MGVEKIRVGNNKVYEAIVSVDCPVCMAKDPRTERLLRKQIDKMLISHPPATVSKMLLKDGIDISKDYLKTHRDKHSTYIKEVKKKIMAKAEELAMSSLDKIDQVTIDAEDVIQDVINIGAQKIHSGEIDVDAKLLTSMIREQGGRKKMGTLQELMQTMDQQRFSSRANKVIEGEIVDEPEKAS
jgi:hypothetical protein